MDHTQQAAQRTVGLLAGNLASIVAVLSVFVLISSFWLEISLEELFTVNFAMDSILTALLYCVMQFSMQENGRRSACLDPVYTDAYKKYRLVRDRILDCGMSGLEAFCIDYVQKELAFARAARLSAIGISYGDWERVYSRLDSASLRSRELMSPDGVRLLSRSERRVLLSVSKMRPIRLTPSMLLLESGARQSRDALARSPEQRLVLSSAISTVTTVIAGCFTASILIEVVSAPTVASFVYCLIKLFCLLWRGARGYISGYKSLTCDAVTYNNARTRILNDFLAHAPVANDLTATK